MASSVFKDNIDKSNVDNVKSSYPDAEYGSDIVNEDEGNVKVEYIADKKHVNMDSDSIDWAKISNSDTGSDQVTGFADHQPVDNFSDLEKNIEENCDDVDQNAVSEKVTSDNVDNRNISGFGNNTQCVPNLNPNFINDCIAAVKKQFTSPYKCTICETEFQKRKMWKSHYMQIHDVDIDTCTQEERIKFGDRPQSYNCIICGQFFDRTNGVVQHIKSHETDVKCGVCGMMFRTFKEYKIHMRHHDVSKHQCNICKKSFTNHLSLERHVKTHSTEKVKRDRFELLCEICSKVFHAPNVLALHLKSHQRQRVPKDLRCHSCNKEYRQARSLKSHIEKVHNGVKDSLVCDIFKESFDTRDEVKAHKKVEHPNTFNECRECNVTLRSKGEYVIHMRKHTGEKPFICDICGLGFIQERYLKRHLVSHSNKRNYSCDYCDSTYKTSSDLVRHLKRVHVDKQTHTCLVCGKGFVNSQLLERHNRTCIHTRNKIKRTKQKDTIIRKLITNRPPVRRKSNTIPILSYQLFPTPEEVFQQNSLMQQSSSTTDEKASNPSNGEIQFDSICDNSTENPDFGDRLLTSCIDDDKKDCKPSNINDNCDNSTENPSLFDKKLNSGVDEDNDVYDDFDLEVDVDDVDFDLPCKFDASFEKEPEVAESNDKQNKYSETEKIDNICNPIPQQITESPGENIKFESGSNDKDIGLQNRNINSSAVKRKRKSHKPDTPSKKSKVDKKFRGKISLKSNKASSRITRSTSKDSPFKKSKGTKNFGEQISPKSNKASSRITRSTRSGKLLGVQTKQLTSEPESTKTRQTDKSMALDTVEFDDNDDDDDGDKMDDTSTSITKALRDLEDIMNDKDITSDPDKNVKNKGDNDNSTCDDDDDGDEDDCNKNELASSETELKPNQCEICKRQLTDEFAYKAHLQIHTTTGTKKRDPTCEECGKKFKKTVSLARHYISHKGQRDFKCQFCPKTFMRKYCLQSHVRIHTGENKRCCEICGNLFCHLAALKYHINVVHKGIPQKKPCPIPQCAVCGKFVQDMRHHMKSHRDENDYVCSVCGKSFPRLKTLNVHMKRHSSVKQFKCSFAGCGKCYAIRCELKKHEETHKKNPNVFRCKICVAWYNTEAELTNHIALHNSRKKFTCSICNRPFSKENNLKYHMHTHTGEKPFDCSVCHRSFTRKDTVKKHMKEQHGTKSEKYGARIRKKKPSAQKVSTNNEILHDEIEMFNLAYHNSRVIKSKSEGNTNVHVCE